MGVKVQVPNDIWRHEIMFWMFDNLTENGWKEVFEYDKVNVRGSTYNGRVKMRPFREFEIYDEQEASWFMLRWL